jgi:hypothetical protein
MSDISPDNAFATPTNSYSSRKSVGRSSSSRLRDKFLSGEEKLFDGEEIQRTPKSNKTLSCDGYLSILGIDRLLGCVCQEDLVGGLSFDDEHDKKIIKG